MSVLPSPVFADSWFARAREIAADLLIATALIWTLPLLLAAAAGLVRLLRAAG